MRYGWPINRIIKALVLFCAVSFIYPAGAFAVPAAPFEHTLKQKDGTDIKARQWGDEQNHGFESLEGYQIVFDAATGNWVYAVEDRSGNPKGPVAPSYRRLRASFSVGKAQAAVSPAGIANIATILVNFSDTATTHTRQDFESNLFGSGVNSMKDYYEEASYGAFGISSGPAGVWDWVAAPKTHDYYGENDAEGFDMYAAELVINAATAADPNFNFAPYDEDGDCYVDALAVIHQGTGEEASPNASDIWSHQYDLNSAKAVYQDGSGEYTTNDACPSQSGQKIKVNRYIIMSELMPAEAGGGIATIGVFAHEFGHMLGLPDLYDIDYSSAGVGFWDLMASGAWNKVAVAGDSPAYFSAWSKYKLGWLTPQVVGGTLSAESIEQAETTKDVYRLLEGDEYFLVENRQQTGFDAGLPGSGLAIWHIDEAKANSSNTDNSLECIPFLWDCSTYHYRVALVQADGLWELEKNTDPGDGGDLYPGIKNNDAFGLSTTPNSELYNGTASNVVVASIGPSGSSMTATLAIRPNNPPVAASLLYPENGTTGLCTTVTVKWQKAADPDGDAVTYRLYLSTDANFTSTPAIRVASERSGGPGVYFAGTAALFLIGMLSGRPRRRVFFIMLVVTAGLISCGGDIGTSGTSGTSGDSCASAVVIIGTGEAGYEATGLLHGVTYYWKVQSDDGWGGRATSETRHFTTQ